MKSVKRGRGPSMMGGLMSIFVGLFGIAWTAIAASMGAGFMAIFGVIFVIIAIVQAVYQFKNATSKNRYSEFDITDSHEEPDPLNERFGGAWQDPAPLRDPPPHDAHPSAQGGLYCPYCGAPVELNFAFCNKCGKKLPE